MPAEVEKVVLGDVSLLYDDNLIVKSADVVEKDGVKVIRIVLNGVQDKYSVNSLVSGVNVIIPATVIVKKDIASTDSAVGVVYANESGVVNDYERDGLASKSVNVKIVSRENNIAEQIQREENNESNESDVKEVENDNISIEVTPQVGRDVLKDNDVVYAEEIIKYTVKVTNNSNSILNNIKVVSDIPEGTIWIKQNDISTDLENPYDEELFTEDASKTINEENIERLNPGEVFESSFTVRVKQIEENQEKDIKLITNVYKENTLINTLTNELIATIGSTPYFLTFSICFPKLTIPALSASTFASFKSSFLTPPLYFKARTVATITTALGAMPAFLHLISMNFSAPRSAPKPASVTQ